mgnify:CR=1 FL=1
MLNIIKSFKYAIEGLWAGIITQRNMKIHILIAVAVIILGCVLEISKWEWITCIILIGLVISAELMNTAVEAVVDMVTSEQSPKAKLAKDTAAGAVLIVSITAAIVGAVIFLPKLFV